MDDSLGKRDGQGYTASSVHCVMEEAVRALQALSSEALVGIPLNPHQKSSIERVAVAVKRAVSSQWARFQPSPTDDPVRAANIRWAALRSTVSSAAKQAAEQHLEPASAALVKAHIRKVMLKAYNDNNDELGELCDPEATSDTTTEAFSPQAQAVYVETGGGPGAERAAEQTPTDLSTPIAAGGVPKDKLKLLIYCLDSKVVSMPSDYSLSKMLTKINKVNKACAGDKDTTVAIIRAGTLVASFSGLQLQSRVCDAGMQRMDAVLLLSTRRMMSASAAGDLPALREMLSIDQGRALLACHDDERGMTPLMHAAANSRSQACALLLEHGASVTARCSQARVPRPIAECPR